METYYYKQVDEQGNVVSLVSYSPTPPNITDTSYVQITAEEFETLLAEIIAKREAEIEESDNISAAEALNIILGGEQ